LPTINKGGIVLNLSSDGTLMLARSKRTFILANHITPSIPGEYLQRRRENMLKGKINFA
jgi:hypothetical protein